LILRRRLNSPGLRFGPGAVELFRIRSATDLVALMGIVLVFDPRVPQRESLH
jgi:hypothetical protein